MTDRIAIIGENSRASTRGMRQTGEAEFTAWQRDDDVLDYTLDYAGWLGADTISAVSRAASGTTSTGTSNTTTQAVQKLQSAGYLDITITTTAGKVRTDRICIMRRGQDSLAGDAYR